MVPRFYMLPGTFVMPSRYFYFLIARNFELGEVKR